MKKKLLSILLCLVMVVGLLPTAVLAADEVAINETNFPDANFRNYVKTEFDTDGDNKLSSAEIAAVTKIEANNKGIKSLDGVGYFTALETLTCSDNELTGLDLSKNTALKELQCSNSKLQSLDLSQNTKLTYLYCGRNPLTTLDLSKNANLKVLNCSGFASKHMELTELDLSQNTALESLDCSLNELTQLNVSGCTALYKLDCSGNQLGALDVSTNEDLIELLCSSNQLVALDVSKNTKLEKLYCWDNFLAALDVSKNTKLKSIDCKKNRLTSLDLDKNENIADVNLDNQQFYNSTLLAGGTFNLNDLPGNFVPGRATNWVGGTVNETTGILTVNASATKVTYKYKTKSGSEDPKYLMPCEMQVPGGTTPPTTYTVSFNANGGSGTMTAATGISGNYTLPANGFTAPADQQFKGWATSASGAVITGTSINVTENTTLYAIWEPIPVTTYTVSFDANGGTGTMPDVTGVSGEYTLPANGFTAPSGKQFKGWATSADGSVISGTTYEVSSDTTFYAIWESKEYSITVTDGKATIGAGSEISKAAEGTAVTLTANAAPSDKVFDKWEVVSGGITLADANSATTTFTMPASAVSVKATYKNAPHTHTYNQETVKPEALKTPADCTSNAVYFKSCSCGTISTTDTFVAMNTALGHAHGSDWKYDSTNHWHECSRCHDKKDEAAHDYGSDNVCDTCGYYKTVPHTHNLTLVAAKAATCTTAGNSAYYTCDGCDKWFADATGSVEITDKTSVKIPAPGHTAGTEWKADDTNHWHECTVAGCGVIIESTKSAHTEGGWIVDTPATATTSGSKHKECTVCRYTMATETIPATGGGYYYAPTAAVVPDMPMLYRGCTGDAVKTLQDKLNALGYNSGNVDGIFGAKTYAAVTAFQKANSLGVDGIVGKLTWGKLYGVSPAMPVETTTVVGRPMVSYGSRGDAVRKLQELLNALGYDCGSVDGIFGSKTKAAVLAFQKANGLGADGIVGPLTWAKLG